MKKILLYSVSTILLLILGGYLYQNSQVNAMTIIGDFFVENEKEGQYWVAATHYLRSITKMAYGASSNAGATEQTDTQLLILILT